MSQKNQGQRSCDVVSENISRSSMPPTGSSTKSCNITHSFTHSLTLSPVTLTTLSLASLRRVDSTPTHRGADSLQVNQVKPASRRPTARLSLARSSLLALSGPAFCHSRSGCGANSPACLHNSYLTLLNESRLDTV